jgi:type II secretory pathway pseudopilin PulG
MQLFSKRRSGFSMVETIVAIGVFSIFFASIAFILQQVLENVGTARVRAVALSLGQEKMELIRNLPYTNVGTIGGIPNGPIQQIENIIINSTAFTVTTSIFYIDDPFDQSAPTDPIPADYKRVRVQVTWGGLFPSRLPVTLVTNIVPKGLESNPGGGTLIVQVLNSQGLPVSNSNVTITNTLVTPNINVSTLTNANGMVVIPAAPACITCYNISVTKAGFSTDRTYTSSEVANPLQPPPTVIEGSVIQVSFSIDQTGSLSISSRSSQETGYLPLTNVIFALRGTKIIGHDTQDNPVIKYSQQFTTGGGTVGIPNLEWDTYTVDLTDSNYTMAGSTPLNPISVLPGVYNIPMTIVADPKFASSLLVTVKDTMNQLVSSVAATLLNNTSGVELTKITAATGSANMGQVFFNNLTLGNYLLTASLSGYQTATSSLTINGNKQTTVVLNQ